MRRQVEAVLMAVEVEPSLAADSAQAVPVVDRGWWVRRTPWASRVMVRLAYFKV